MSSKCLSLVVFCAQVDVLSSLCAGCTIQYEVFGCKRNHGMQYAAVTLHCLSEHVSLARASRYSDMEDRTEEFFAFAFLWLN